MQGLINFYLALEKGDQKRQGTGRFKFGLIVSLTILDSLLRERERKRERQREKQRETERERERNRETERDRESLSIIS